MGKEADLQNSVLELLRYQGIFAWRQGNHSVFDTQTKRYRSKSKFELNGVSDILGVLPGGKILAIEVKRDKKSAISKDQILFLEKVNSLGGVGFIAFNLDDVDRELEEFYERPVSKNPN